ncbi:MAG: S41 family peptidase [Blastocatellia bacterium]|nr:S41 family peptidase [Blastocatellia bacterium]
MKARTAFVRLALIGVLCASMLLTFADRASSFQQKTAASAFANLQAQNRAPSRPERRFGTSFVVTETKGTLFENVAKVLQTRYYDKRFRTEVLPKLVSEYADKAKQAKTLNEQRDAVHEMLGQIPASHLGLLSKQTHRYIIDDLRGRPYPTFGFQLVAIKGEFYAFFVLEGGPAARAGLLAWDRVISIDGLPVKQSQRLDWRSDDAYIKDDRDPPVHYLIAERGARVQIKVERSRGKFMNIRVPAEDYSAFEAAKASARIYRDEGHTVGYLHFWYIHLMGVPELLKDKLEGEFKDCDAVMIDLRGRGGNGMAISQIIDLLRAENSERHRPVVALVDRQSRSAKDVLAYEMKKRGLARVVGERTAGAVIPASFADVGHETVLMFPMIKFGPYTDLLEFKPVEPDVFVERAAPFSAGEDPILKAGLAEAVRLVKASAKQAGQLIRTTGISLLDKKGDLP